MIVLFYCIIYKLLCYNTNWTLTIKNIKNNFILFFFGVVSFVLGMIMQYHFCIMYPKGELYHNYHGLWHFFMFTSAGIWMRWNEGIRITSNKITNAVTADLENQVKLDD